MSEQGTATGVVSSDRLVVRAVLRSDVGLVRTENQDYGTLTTSNEEQGKRPGGRLLIVADGMGGHRGGATASRLAGETVKTQYLSANVDDVTDVLRKALLRANARVFMEAQANPELRGMGTTTSALAVRGNEAWFAHVGDSRIYLVRGDEIKQLTEDHSLVASMVREGLITAKEAETHPRRNVLQRSIGVGEEVDIDVVGPLPIQVGDTFILCSDGLHGLVKEPELLEVAALPIDAAADEFLKRAISRGAPDNVTVIVARVEPATAADQAVDPDRPNAELFDDTVRDTEPMPAPTIDETPQPGTSVAAAPAPGSATASPSASSLTDKTQETPLAAPSEAAQPRPGSNDPTLETPLASELAPTPVAAASDRTLESPIAVPRVETPVEAPAKPQRSRSSAVVKWALLFVVALGAAGAWLFWSQQKGFDRPTSTQSSR